MNMNEMKELIKAVSESELTALDYEEGNIRISLRKGGAEIENMERHADAGHQEMNRNSVMQKLEKSEESQEIAEEEVSGNIVKSPLVGMAYLAPEEGAEPFVQVGDVVKKGQTLAIVEAMKLMNEIESDFDGVVKKVLVENGKPVEYGQPMFVLS